MNGKRDIVEVSHRSLARVESIARAAGTAIMRHYSREALSSSAMSKVDGTPVTAADHEANALVCDELYRWDPETPVISEESALPPYEARRHWRRFWLVDPLDGTKEFITRNDEFTVNIALICDGDPLLGVVHAPALGVTWVAGAGLGSWRIEPDGRRSRISHSPCEENEPLSVVESRSHGSPELEAYLATIRVRERIRVGSSLKFCWVAEGRADIYPRLGPTMEWDVAAGDCVYRNSGERGPLTSPLTYNKPDLKNGSFVLGRAGALLP